MIRDFVATFVVSCSLATGLAQAESAVRPDEGLKHLAWQDAHTAVGETAFISGKIIRVGSSGRVNFLNFDNQRPPEFVVIIFADSLENFLQPLKETYEGKIIRVRGRVILYRDKPQIVVNHPDQIEILDRLPATDDANPAEVTRPLAVEGQLLVATYNALNLFDEHDDPYQADESTPSKPREQLERLAQSIAKLNADVVAFQEVESRFYLERFVRVFLPEMGYDHVVHFEGNDTRGIDVCLISRVPVGPVRSHRHVEFLGPDDTVRRFNRDLLAAKIEPPGAEPLEVWVVHLKSNSGGREFAEPVRLAEARELRAQLDEKLGDDPKARILVLGDFNDTWGSETLQTIVGEGPLAMWSAASEFDGGLPNTYNQGEYQSMIDFILCSPAMAGKYVRDTFQVLPGTTETTGSDHNPVSMSFHLD